jgi:hypothetical protein
MALCGQVMASVREALDNPGVDPRLTSKPPAASRMLRVLVEVFQSFLRWKGSSKSNGCTRPQLVRTNSGTAMPESISRRAQNWSAKVIKS